MANKTLKTKIEGVELNIYPNILTANISDVNELAKLTKAVILLDVHGKFVNINSGLNIQDVVNQINTINFQTLGGLIIDCETTLNYLLSEFYNWQGIIDNAYGRDPNLFLVSSIDFSELDSNLGMTATESLLNQQNKLNNIIIFRFPDHLLFGTLCACDQDSNLYKFILPSELRGDNDTIILWVQVNELGLQFNFDTK